MNRSPNTARRLALLAVMAAAFSTFAVSAASAASFTPANVTTSLSGTLTFENPAGATVATCPLSNYSGVVAAAGASWDGNLQYVQCTSNGTTVPRLWRHQLIPIQNPDGSFSVQFQKFGIIPPASPRGQGTWNQVAATVPFVNGTPEGTSYPYPPATASRFAFNDTPVGSDSAGNLTVSGVITMGTAANRVTIVP